MMKAFSLLLVLILWPTGAGYSQADPAKPIFTFRNTARRPDHLIDFSETEWQPDSQSLQFRFIRAADSLRLTYFMIAPEGARADGAGFIAGDENHLLVVTDRINTRSADWVYFAPDVGYALGYDYLPQDTAGQQLTLFQLD